MPVRLAQIFDVNGAFVPSKVSLYLKRVNTVSSSNFTIEDETSVDASNFSSIEQGHNKLIFSDDEAGYTGNGYLTVVETNSQKSYAVANYPISTAVPRKIYLYVRAISSTGSFVSKVLIDGKQIGVISQVSSGSWEWFEITFALPDSEEHILGLSLEESGSSIDKLVIRTSSSSLSGEGPDLTISPYVTVHVRLYDVDSDLLPTIAKSTYDYKTTIDDLISDGWYNFDTKTFSDSLDDSFSGSVAIVASASGSSPVNFVVWDLVNNDEYELLPSAMKVV